MKDSYTELGEKLDSLLLFIIKNPDKPFYVDKREIKTGKIIDIEL